MNAHARIDRVTVRAYYRRVKGTQGGCVFRWNQVENGIVCAKLLVPTKSAFESAEKSEEKLEKWWQILRNRGRKGK